MKQHITHEQFNELNSEADMKLRKWLQPPKLELGGDISEFMTIGRMIEFLGMEIMRLEFEVDEWYLNNMGYKGDHVEWNDREICDVLWKAVKDVLNETTQ